jgi:hypothetical protein
LNDNEIIISIAEGCGWTRDVAGQWLDPDRFYRPSGSLTYAQHSVEFNSGGLPDFLNDLNAMHEVEKTLSVMGLARYNFELHRIVVNQEGLTCEAAGWVTNATARQRAEAFLRTIGKWKDK